MQDALGLAAAGRWHTPPNPSVGCVICSASGEVLGQGHTQAVGQAHAEVMALRDAQGRGHDVRGATAWVTLEPCAHQGRTGPCCDALAQAGIARVVASLADPNPLVAGRGFERLRAAGVAVSIGPGAQAARELNIGFFSRMVRRMPWVRVKTAASLDGRTALPDGRSQWITSAQARADGHLWRARACAVLTGVGTVLRDNARLDARAEGVRRQPHRVIVDSQLRTPLDAAVFEPEGQVWIYTACTDAARRSALQQRGARVIDMPDGRGQVDLRAMLADMATREINEVHVEAGQTLASALLRDGLVDEWLLYLAPCLLGDGPGIARIAVPDSLDQALRLQLHGLERVGPDLRLLARIPARDTF